MKQIFCVTWQPDVAEAGHYFVTFVEAEPDTSLDQIMLKAHEIEGLDMDTYELCSVFYVTPDAHDGDTQVIY